MKQISGSGLKVMLPALVVAGMLITQGCQTQRHEANEAPPVPVMPPRTTPDAAGPDLQVTPPALHPDEEAMAKIDQVTGETYVVKKGDSLAGIAHRYGVSTRELMELNKIKNPNRICVGQKLQLPLGAKLVTNQPPPKRQRYFVGHKNAAAPMKVPEGCTVYVVKSGDALSKIAVRNGVTIKAIREANQMKDDKIYVGQKLIIPKATAAAVANGSKKAANGAKETVQPPKAEKTPVTTPATITNAAPAAPAETPAVDAAATNAANQGMVFTYTFSEGDTLNGIARTFGVLKEDLMRVNNIKDPNSIKPGQKLVIPIAAP